MPVTMAGVMLLLIRATVSKSMLPHVHKAQLLAVLIAIWHMTACISSGLTHA